jgi:hypothetical protein
VGVDPQSPTTRTARRRPEGTQTNRNRESSCNEASRREACGYVRPRVLSVIQWGIELSLAQREGMSSSSEAAEGGAEVAVA